MIVPRLNKKAVIILSILSLSAIALVFYQVVINKKVVVPNEKFQQPLNIQNYFQGAKLPIENDIKRSDFVFPQSLPYLLINTQPNLENISANRIASNLGFNGDPLTFQDIKNGTTLIWNGDKYSLNIIPKTGFIQLSSNDTVRNLISNLTDGQINEDNFKSLAQDFLVSKINLNQEKTKFVGYTYFKVQNGVEYLSKGTKSDFQIIQLNYSESVSKYPLFTTNPDQSQISIQFLKDGSILTFTANLGFQFQESTISYPLKTFDQFTSSIPNSVLVSLNDNNVNLADIRSSDIKKITVNKISLVYLIDFSNLKVVQPVFLLDGNAQVLGFNKEISASLYLPAFEGFSQP